MYKSCPVCHAQFYTRISTQKYCSKQCYKKGSKMEGVATPKRESDLGVRSVKPSRKCHDCGRPTFDYRCERCWEKVRKEWAW